MRLLKHLTANAIKLDEYPFKSERVMQAYLIENESVLSLDEGNFEDIVFLDEEVAVTQGRESLGTDGRIDILALYSQEYIAVVELKLHKLEEKHLRQLEDYLDKKQLIAKTQVVLSENIDEPKWAGVLVGEGIDSELSKIIEEGYNYKGMPIAAIILRRFRDSNGGVYIAADTIFKTSAKDNTKYQFNGKSYGKGRLVLAVIKHYVEENPTTYAGLEGVFPKSLQGSNGVFSTQDDAQKIVARTSRKRHFLGPDELIQLEDSVIAVSSQWGVGNIGKFIEKATELGCKITYI